MAPRLLAALLATSAACGSSLPFSPAGPDDAPDPTALGPFAVGVRTVTFTDITRTNPMTGAPRSLVTEIWYPALDEGGAKQEYDLLDALPPNFAAEHGLTVLGTLKTDAVRDAPLDDSHGPYPLVVFSHGNGGIRMQSTFFTVALASHGFVVASPDHEGNTIGALLQAGIDGAEDSFLGSYLERPLDMKVVIDRMSALDDPLREQLDLDRIGIAGHSLGAVTALRTASIDRRIKAVVAHAPAGFMLTSIDLPRPMNTLGIPIQVQGGLRDKILPADLHSTSYWDQLERPRFELTLATAGHFTFSDLCTLDRGALETLAMQGLDVRNALNDGCGPEDLDAATAIRVLRHFNIAMFNGYLRDSLLALEALDETKGRTYGAELTFRGEHAPPLAVPTSP